MNIPKKLFGIDGKEALERMLKEETSKPKKEPEATIQVPSGINPSEYIRIKGTEIVIAKRETQKGVTWEQTHYKLAEQGLFMPPMGLFMQYLLSVRDAAQGKEKIVDGNNRILTHQEAKEQFGYLTRPQQNGAWTWLDAKFRRQRQQMYIQTDHRIRITNGKQILEGKEIPLETKLTENACVTLNFNSQGLPTQKSPTQEYRQGENLYFCAPRDGRVAWFGVGTVRAVLGCGGIPRDSNSGVGVFACAAGTHS